MENYVNKRIDGRYEIHEIIGVGGMAVVYKAYDNIDDRIVAIKILKEEYISNEEFRRRFKNESKYISVLSHPNIVKVFDVSFGDRLQYIVMEYIEGITLKEYIQQQGIIQPREAILFVTQILRALQHAHDKGIVHRDVKPQNIILLSNGSIKVTDFGIASFSRSDSRTIAEGAIGSVHYISPEQARGDFTDAKADIYSVGVVLYEMLTGSLPFQSDNAVSVALMQLQDDPINPREINEKIPMGLEQITMHAMQKDPRARYQSAAEMLLDIDEFKKNPSIVFDYSYFVDNEPTKYIDKNLSANRPPVVKAKPEKPVSKPVDDIDEEEAESNSRLVPILTGAIVGLVGVLVLIVLFLFLFTDIFKGSKVKTPDFSGMNYAEEIQNNSEYSNLRIQIEYDYSSDFAVGTVIEQTPDAGDVLGEGETITLVINSNKTAIVNDVYGQAFPTAVKALESAGFKTTYEMVFDTTVEEGIVLSTMPERGDEAELGSIITVYVSSHTDALAIETPKLVNYSLETAEDLLKSVGLEIGEITEVDNVAEKGTVLEQIPEEGDPLHAGDKVDIVISSGKAPTSTVDLTIPLPDIGSLPGSIKVYLNNASVESLAKEVLLDGGTYSVQLSGSGAADSVIVKVNNLTIYSCTINFTSNPVQVSNRQTVKDVYHNSFYNPTTVPNASTIPNIVGSTREDAIRALNNRGFYNIEIKETATLDNSKINVVLSQSPEINILQQYKPYPIDTVITLEIGKGVFDGNN